MDCSFGVIVTRNKMNNAVSGDRHLAQQTSFFRRILEVTVTLPAQAAV
jgi:hypothetical protein